MGRPAEGAYLAPDRVIERVTTTRGGMFDRGYLEHLQINGHTYRLMEVGGRGGMGRGHELARRRTSCTGTSARPSRRSPVPLVSGADWGEAAVTAELPGSRRMHRCDPHPGRRRSRGRVRVSTRGRAPGRCGQRSPDRGRDRPGRGGDAARGR